MIMKSRTVSSSPNLKFPLHRAFFHFSFFDVIMWGVTPAANMESRKKIYEKWIQKSLAILKALQDVNSESHTYGSFFKPRITGDATHDNARWQEAVLSLAYEQKYFGTDNKKRIIAGIDYLCKLQNRNGSFPEATRRESAFSATGFCLYAACEAANIVGLNEEWTQPFLRAGDWLAKNDEIILTNQEAAAALALLKLCSVTGIPKYREAAETKLKRVMRNQMPNGHYAEKGGADAGYSSLTIELLSAYHAIRPENEIEQSAERYFRHCAEPLKNSRNTNWRIVAGFEYFSHFLPAAKAALKAFLATENVIHLPDDRHVCTDLYRLFRAWIYCNQNVESEKVTAHLAKPVTDKEPKHRFPFLRRFGSHKIRRILYSWNRPQ